MTEALIINVVSRLSVICQAWKKDQQQGCVPSLPVYLQKSPSMRADWGCSPEMPCCKLGTSQPLVAA